jgi:hypothetical protein
MEGRLLLRGKRLGRALAIIGAYGLMLLSATRERPDTLYWQAPGILDSADIYKCNAPEIRRSGDAGTHGSLHKRSTDARLSL